MDEIEDLACNGVDDLISKDHEELSSTVARLNVKVQQHENEIICLKSALADAIRRLSILEATKGNKEPVAPPHQNNILPNRTSPFRPLYNKRLTSADRRAHPSDSVSLTTNRCPIPTSQRAVTSPRTNGHLKKWSSLSTNAELNNANLTPAKRSGSHSNLLGRSSIKGAKEPVWMQEEGSLKIFLRGRAVTLYSPASLSTNYNVTKVGEAPAEKLQLEWVYGYRGRDCRSNLYLLPTGEMIYFSAAVVVLYNVEEQMQRHYMGHTDDVKCIAVHPDKIKIASGQVAGHDRKEGRRRLPSHTQEGVELNERWPHVRIWDSVTLNTLNVIGIGDFERAVCCVGFSKLDGGQHLLVVDDANEHVLSVWDLSRDKPHKITETKSSTEPVLGGEFHPFEKCCLVTCGKNQVSFWTLDSGTLSKRVGIYDKNDKPKYVVCLAFADNGDVLTGDSNGNIFVWGKGTNRISQAITGAHEGGVFSLCVTKAGTLLSGGGKDRKIIQWDEHYAKTGVESLIPEQFGAVRTLSQGKGNLILVGTTRNCILQGTIDLEFNPIVQGHVDELWGLAAHPSQNQFLTCGSDKHIYLWDSLSHSVVWSKEVNDSVHSCCFHPDASVVAIGTHCGRWLILDLSTREVVSVHTDGNEQIECVEYSPDGQYLALGSRDNLIYVYQVGENATKYSRVGKCMGHSSFVTHVDWSENSLYLQSNSGDYEVLYWTASTCKQLTNMPTVRDTEWASQNCTLTFNAAGIWPRDADGTDVNAGCRSHKKHLVASADDFGKVNLYKYPCCQPKSSGGVYGGHSSHVTNVRFLHDDSRLVSTGGRDMAIMQWEVV